MTTFLFFIMIEIIFIISFYTYFAKYFNLIILIYFIIAVKVNIIKLKNMYSPTVSQLPQSTWVLIYTCEIIYLYLILTIYGV